MESRSIWNGIKVGCVVMAMACVPAWGGAQDSGILLDTMLPNDVRLFDFGSIPAGDVLFGMTTPIEGLPTTDEPDTTVGTFLSSDATFSSPFTFNALSNAGDNTLGALDGAVFRVETPATDSYTVAVTGDGDEFDGFGHTESGNYLLSYGQIDPTSLGGDFADNDSTNDTSGGADTISLGAVDAQVAVNTFDAAGDVDWYRVYLDAGDIFTAMTAPLAGLSSDFDSPDTYVAIFDPSVSGLAANEDAGGLDESITYSSGLGSDFPTNVNGPTAFGSAAKIVAPADGFYYLAVTGFNDTTVTGNHNQQGDYGLLVSRYQIPEPTSLALVGLLGLGLLGRAGNRANRA
jgi:hypothetical protein